MGKIILMISLVLFSGCASTVSLVKEIEGCKIYRISNPLEENHYFSSCGKIQ